MVNKLENLFGLIQIYPKRFLAVAGLALILVAIPLTLFVAGKQQNLTQNAATFDLTNLPSPNPITGCVPMPKCFTTNPPTCKLPSYIPNSIFCKAQPLPTATNTAQTPKPQVTPIPSNCHYEQVACPLACPQGQPCPTCAPKLVCSSPTPAPTCFPAPACLSANPPCKIPVPAQGWCSSIPTTPPTPTSTPCLKGTSGNCPGDSPTPSPVVVGLGQVCGGFILPVRTCATGLTCKIGRIADAGGTCIQTLNPTPTPSPIVGGTPGPTCIPEPACAHSNPPCELAFPIGGWCPTPPPTPTPPPAGNTVINMVNVGFDGIGGAGDHQAPLTNGNLNPKHPVREITVEIYDTKGNLVDTEKGTVTYLPEISEFTGFVSLKPTISTGNYIVKVSSPGYLKKQVDWAGLITQGQQNALPPIYLTTGDINQDNVLNILDYNILLSCSIFSKDKGSTCSQNSEFKAKADLNDDGNVDQDDYSLLLRDWLVQVGQ